MFEIKIKLIGNKADQKLDADGNGTTQKVTLTFKGNGTIKDKEDGETFEDRAEVKLTINTGPVGRDIVLSRSYLEKLGESINLSFIKSEETKDETPESNKINRMSPTKSIIQHFEV